MGDLKFYDYPVEIDGILARAEDGELTPELEQELDVLMDRLPHKAASVFRVIRTQELLEEGCQEEINRLRTVKCVLGRRVSSLRAYLCRCMAAMGIKKLETEIGTISRVQNSRPRITWDDSYGEIPREFTRTKIETVPDGDAIYRAYVNNQLPDGFIVALGESLRVR